MVLEDAWSLSWESHHAKKAETDILVCDIKLTEWYEESWKGQKEPWVSSTFFGRKTKVVGERTR